MTGGDIWILTLWSIRNPSKNWRRNGEQNAFEGADSKTTIRVAFQGQKNSPWLFGISLTGKKYVGLVVTGRAQSTSTVQGRIHFPARYNLPTSMSFHQVTSIRIRFSSQLRTTLDPYNSYPCCSPSDTHIRRLTWSVSRDTHRALDRGAFGTKPCKKRSCLYNGSWRSYR
jgi:hypothetical protein